MSGESDEANLAVFFSLGQRLGCSIRADKKFGIVVEAHAVDLPKIEMIGLQAAQRFFQHFESKRSVAPMRAGLGHQKNFVAASFQSCTHPEFGLAAPVLPAIVEKSDTAVDGLVDHFDCGLLIGRVAEMMASEAECRNFRISAAELSHGDGSGGRLRH